MDIFVARVGGNVLITKSDGKQKGAASDAGHRTP